MEQMADVATRVVMISTQGIITTFVIAVCMIIFDIRIALILLVGIGIFSLFNTLMQKATVPVAQKRMKGNYRKIVGFNAGLILLGAVGILQPTFTALLHNGSTVAISMKSMTNLLEKE